MGILLQIISVLCAIYSGYHSGKIVIDMINGNRALRKISMQDVRRIRCINLLNNPKVYLTSAVLDLVMIYCFYKMYIYTKLVGYTLGTIMFILLIAVWIISLITHIVALMTDKYGYLTEEGMVHFLGTMKFENCRFVWEQQPDGRLANILLIYKPKAKTPMRFQFEEDLEEAHEITRS